MAHPVCLSGTIRVHGVGSRRPIVQTASLGQIGDLGQLVSTHENCWAGAPVHSWGRAGGSGQGDRHWQPSRPWYRCDAAIPGRCSLLLGELHLSRRYMSNQHPVREFGQLGQLGVYRYLYLEAERAVNSTPHIDPSLPIQQSHFHGFTRETKMGPSSDG